MQTAVQVIKTLLLHTVSSDLDSVEQNQYVFKHYWKHISYQFDRITKALSDAFIVFCYGLTLDDLQGISAINHRRLLQTCSQFSHQFRKIRCVLWFASTRQGLYPDFNDILKALFQGKRLGNNYQVSRSHPGSMGLVSNDYLMPICDYMVTMNTF